MKGDRAFGLITLLVAVGYLASSTQIPGGFIDDPLGPKFFPLVIGSVAALCALAMIVRPDDDPGWPDRATWLKIAFALAVLLGYAFTLRPMGFIIPTAVGSALLSYLIRPSRAAAVVTGVCLSVGLFVLFRYALGLGLYAFPRSWTG